MSPEMRPSGYAARTPGTLTFASDTSAGLETVDYAIGNATAVLFYAGPARTYDVDVFISLETPVPSPHLAALAFQAGGARRRERAWQLLETGGVDRVKLQTLLAAHGIGMKVDDER